MKKLIVLIAVVAFSFSVNAQNVNDENVALEGYSPVSYFEKNKAEMGKKAYTSEYKGVKYLFANAKQKKTFDKKPEKYIPQYGGWCATGMTMGGKYKTNPKSFIVKDGKLFLFKKNKEMDTKKMWEMKDHKMMQTKADEKWAEASKK